ncbi:MAG TPA: DUF1634 domain-containing protein, partial [Isosphaeraceae bacterium]|nr:DUF1634 domain-containing protein [Isosphaeraceae bacterium]
RAVSSPPGLAEDRERSLDHWVHLSLLAGLIVCGILLILGLSLTLIAGTPEGSGPPPGFRLLVRQAIRGDGPSLIRLGLLALLATPVLRVVVLSIGWFRLGDRRFASVAATVLVLLIVGVILGVG